MSSEEAVHVSRAMVTPSSGKGTLGTWSFRRSAGWSDTEPTMSPTWETELGPGQTTEVGVYCESALKPRQVGKAQGVAWPRLRTVPGKAGRTGLSGGLWKRSYGGNENPTRNRKSGLGNPPPKAGASELYPNKKQADALHGTAVTGAQARREGFTENNVGKVPLAVGAGRNLQRLLERGLGRRRGERVGSANESVRAKTGE